MNRILALAAPLAAAITIAAAHPAVAQRQTGIAELLRQTHVHGLAVDGADASRLYVATHHGLFVVDASGMATRISTSRDDFMGFTPHPTDPSILYASGHPAAGGNLGVIVSKDGGRTWAVLSEGVGGPVDFHQMDVSKSNPDVIYGVHGGLQKSTDGGRSWTMVGPAPEGLIDLVVGGDPDTLYAATQQGLLKSTDRGGSWAPAYPVRRPVSMVQATGSGYIYAFVVETGLIRASEVDLNWRIVGDDFDGAYVLHLAVAPTESDRLYAATFDPQTNTQALLVSSDGGASWSELGGGG